MVVGALAPLWASLLVGSGCSEVDTPTSQLSGTGGASSSSSGTAGSGVGGEGGELDICVPSAIYEPCDENPDCVCLQGQLDWRVCSFGCSASTECVDEEFATGIAACAAVSGASSEKFCVLICEGDAECPCGLRCTPTGLNDTSVCAVPP